MKKLSFVMFLIFAAAILCSCEFFPWARDEWHNDDAVYVRVQPAYSAGVLQDINGAFAALGLKAAYATQKYGNELTVLLVLDKRGEAEQEAAIMQLRADERVKDAYKCSDVPFDTVNTLRLTASADTVEAGDTLTIKPEGELKVYDQSFRFDEFAVSLSDYDAEKEYTPADFPQADIVSVEKWRFWHGVCFYLKIANPGYFNVIKAASALALDPAIESVGLCGVGDVIMTVMSGWEISDTSVADFEKEPVIDNGNVYCQPAAGENGEVTVRGKKPGTVTVTYFPSYTLHWGNGIESNFAVTYQITVTGPTDVPHEPGNAAMIKNGCPLGDPGSIIISSVDEMNGYLDRVNALVRSSFGYVPSPSLDPEAYEQYLDEWMESFKNKYFNYDAGFFADDLLFVANFAESSGSIRHEIENVTYSENLMSVYLKKIAPEVGTCDMAYWTLVIEVLRSEFNGTGAELIVN